MIVYQPAFDLYHTVYRLITLLSYFDRNEYIEIERLRIWDYYFLYPNKLKEMSFKQDEKQIKDLINNHIFKPKNPYEQILNDRKMFEKIRPYQMSAIKYLASLGIINKDYLKENRITKISKDIFNELDTKFEKLSVQEINAVKLLTSHFYFMPLYGENGLKEKTKLLESKYDA
jgi:hypothetical protein